MAARTEKATGGNASVSGSVIDQVKRKGKRESILSHIPADEYRLVLIGRTGEGKSSTGNTIFGKRVFKALPAAGSVTAQCNYHKAEVQGRQVLLVDTPGLFDTEREHDVIKDELLKFIAYTSPGPHAILLVIRIGQFTDETSMTYKYVKGILGNNGNDYTLLVFTGGDDLEYEGTTIKEYLKGAPNALQKILKDTEGRYVVLNNHAVYTGKESQDQVSDLLREIDRMLVKNAGSYYESDTYEDAEGALLATEHGRRQSLKADYASEQAMIDQAFAKKQADLKTRLREKQIKIDQLQQEEKRKKKLIEHKNRAISKAETEYEAKLQALREDYEARLSAVRDETRRDIESERIKVSEPWFRDKLRRAGKQLKKVIGLK